MQTYSEENVLPKGVVEVEFSYKWKNVRSKFLITSDKYPNVLGRDVLSMLFLNWNKLFGILMISDCSMDVALKNIFSEYQDVFKDELGILKNV